MPHNQCPPSRRGHTWRELRSSELPRGSIAVLKVAAAIRVCDRCGTPGRVDGQGVIHVIDAAVKEAS
jgi:hypothetical protein